MKKAVLAMIFGAVLLVGALPKLILSRVERYPVAVPQLVSYQPSIRCEGRLCPSEGYQLLSSGLYLVEERYHAMGDPVEKGETLAVLAPAAGEAVLYLQTQGSGLSIESVGSGLEALLKGYGGMETEPEADWQKLLTVGEAREEDGAWSREGERVTVTSPISGVITREVPVPGSVIRPGGVIASAEGREGFFALLTVGEKDAAKISVGDRAVLSGEGFGNGSCEGSVTRIYPGTRKELSGSVTRNVVDIEVSVPLKGPEEPESLEIRPGFSVKAQIFTGEERQILMVPYESIRQETDNTEYITVAGPSGLERRPVTTGQETADGVEITEGLLPDELVALLPEGVGEEEQGRYLLVYPREE